MGGLNMKEFELHGRGAVPGIAEGYAIVCPDSIAGNSGGLGIDDKFEDEIVIKFKRSNPNNE